jgi:hypothetical protein
VKRVSKSPRPASIFRAPRIIEKFGETSLKTDVVLNFALPHCQYTPPSLPQFLNNAPVAFTVSVDLLSPKFYVRRWFAGSRTHVAVPETPVDEYRTLTTPEHNIGAARQIPCVKAVSVAEAEQKTPHDKFWEGVLATNSRHCGASLLWCQAIQRNHPSHNLAQFITCRGDALHHDERCRV